MAYSNITNENITGQLSGRREALRAEFDAANPIARGARLSESGRVSEEVRRLISAQLDSVNGVDAMRGLYAATFGRLSNDGKYAVRALNRGCGTPREFTRNVLYVEAYETSYTIDCEAHYEALACSQ